MHHHALHVFRDVRQVTHFYLIYVFFISIVYKDLLLLSQLLWPRDQQLAVQVSGGKKRKPQKKKVLHLFVVLMFSSLSAGMCTITWVGNMIMFWRSWLLPCAPTGSPSCGWDPARQCWPGLSSTVSASTLSCGPPSSSPWSLLLLLRFVRGVYALVFMRFQGSQ